MYRHPRHLLTSHTCVSRSVATRRGSLVLPGREFRFALPRCRRGRAEIEPQHKDRGALMLHAAVVPCPLPRPEDPQTPIGAVARMPPHAAPLPHGTWGRPPALSSATHGRMRYHAPSTNKDLLFCKPGALGVGHASSMARTSGPLGGSWSSTGSAGSSTGSRSSSSLESSSGTHSTGLVLRSRRSPQRARVATEAHAPLHVDKRRIVRRQIGSRQASSAHGWGARNALFPYSNA